jgi:hypothetical protein
LKAFGENSREAVHERIRLQVMRRYLVDVGRVENTRFTQIPDVDHPSLLHRSLEVLAQFKSTSQVAKDAFEKVKHQAIEYLIEDIPI